ncbi:BTAD domain-containing putative transcriptional regulator [Microbispora amethystogenes]|uniref:AfsR/SARP family transcriptional regulator n=1 Tax=Microbispora amethystogenes TaxID=1427754 RepID=UPI0033D0CA68
MTDVTGVMVFEFDVLGPLRMSRDGVPVRLGAAMPRRLLATLLCTPGRPVAVPALVEALWGDDPPPSAHKTLQIYVLRLRRALGDRDRVVHGPGGYTAAVSPPELDALRFRELTAAGRAARRNADPAKAGALFRRALGLWRGPAFADSGDGTLVADEARRLEEERLLTCEELAVADLACGRHAELVTGLTEMAELHPYRERLHACLMLALSRAGRQAEALRVYQRVRAMLGEELGVEPGHTLRRVHEAVLRGDTGDDGGDHRDDRRGDRPGDHGGASGSVAGLLLGPEEQAYGDSAAVLSARRTDVADQGGEQDAGPVVAAPCQLPPDIGDLVGRHGPAESLRRCLTGAGDPPATPVVALYGRAGAGKTTLAIHVAHSLGETFADGRLYVDLHGTCPRPADPAKALARLLTALGVAARSVPDGLEERGRLFRAVLADRRVLVVLDDAASEEQVRPLLPGGPGCAVLVTSRRRPAGLSARAVRVDALDPASAATLLGRIAGPERIAARPGVAAEIVRLCGHLPLAVRIAGERLAQREHWTPDHLAGRLREERRRLDELVAGDLSVRARLDADYRGLDAATRRALRMLGLLDVPDFTAWMLAAALGVTVREAEAYADLLVDAQLLSCAGDDADGRFRYRFHDFVRAYARERAELEETDGEREKAVTRVLGALLARAGTAERGLPQHPAAAVPRAAPCRHAAGRGTEPPLVADRVSFNGRGCG